MAILENDIQEVASEEQYIDLQNLAGSRESVLALARAINAKEKPSLLKGFARAQLQQELAVLAEAIQDGDILLLSMPKTFSALPGQSRYQQLVSENAVMEDEQYSHMKIAREKIQNVTVLQGTNNQRVKPVVYLQISTEHDTTSTVFDAEAGEVRETEPHGTWFTFPIEAVEFHSLNRALQLS